MSGKQTLIDEELRERLIKLATYDAVASAERYASSSIQNPSSWDAGSMTFDLPPGCVPCAIVIEPTPLPNTAGKRFRITRIDYCREPGQT
jgi:hypothetical protein